MEEIQLRIERGERVLVTTLTKRMAEELNEFMLKMRIKAAYIHSDVDTLDRIRILDDLRSGTYDVLIGVNLLREGLDLPEVSLVAILDADKEGFLRSHRSLTQTVGRAARNLNGTVIMYADKITDSMRLTIEETERRRAIQLAYNEEHGITPQAIVKARQAIIGIDEDAETVAHSSDGKRMQPQKRARCLYIQIQTGTIYTGIYSQGRHSGRPDCSVYEPRRTTALHNSPAYRNGGCCKGYGFHGSSPYAR